MREGRNVSSKRRGHRNNFVLQGSLLAVAGILVRIIGMVYRIPLTAIISDEGNGYYTSAFSIYTLLLILSSYSMPTAISKLISQNLAKKKYRNTERVIRVSFLYSSLMGAVMAGILFFGADSIAELMKKPYAAFALRALAPTVWIMAYLGLLRGYFQGMGNMIPTAISQILEQIANAIVSVLMAYILFAKGKQADLLYKSSEFSYSYGAMGGAIGTGAGAGLALLFVFVLFRYQIPSLRRKGKKDQSLTDSYEHSAMLLLFTMLPILFSSTVYNISSVLDDFLYSSIMTGLGSKTKQIVLEWGIFGEYHVLFNIPVALANALSSSLIPVLTMAVASHDRKKTLSQIRVSVRFTLLIAVPCSIGMAILAEPLCRMLFPGKHVSLLIQLTRVGSLAVLLYSLSTISNAILQGLGHLNIPLYHSMIALVLHLGSLILFLYLRTGIYGVVLSNIVFALCMCLLNQHAIYKHTRFRIDLFRSLVMPGISALVMGGAAYALYFVIHLVLPEHLRKGRIGSAVSLLPAVFLGILIYFFLLLRSHTLTKEDLDEMPMGGRLKRFL